MRVGAGIAVIVLVSLLLGAWGGWRGHAQLEQGRPRPAGLVQYSWLLAEPGFVLGYSPWWRNPLWVQWTVHAGPLRDLAPRPRHFVCAPDWLGGVCPDDYRRSGYDRGHLAPNYAMSRLYGREAQLASFAMHNISPQRHPLNARAWQRLEELEMDALRPALGRAFVVQAGPLFAADAPRLPGGVAVPAAFWRLWFDPGAAAATGAAAPPRALAFILPQQASGHGDLRQYAVTVDAVEARSGLDLLPALPDAVEAAVEAALPLAGWGVGERWDAPPRY